MSPELIDILLRIEKEKCAEFHDPIHYTISEAVDYLIQFKGIQLKEAEEVVKGRNFCDLKKMLILVRLGYVRESGTISVALKYELSDMGKQYLRDYKIKNIMND